MLLPQQKPLYFYVIIAIALHVILFVTLKYQPPTPLASLHPFEIRLLLPVASLPAQPTFKPETPKASSQAPKLFKGNQPKENGDNTILADRAFSSEMAQNIA